MHSTKPPIEIIFGHEKNIAQASGQDTLVESGVGHPFRLSGGNTEILIHCTDNPHCSSHY